MVGILVFRLSALHATRLKIELNAPQDWLLGELLLSETLLDNNGCYTTMLNKSKWPKLAWCVA